MTDELLFFLVDPRARGALPIGLTVDHDTTLHELVLVFGPVLREDMPLSVTQHVAARRKDFAAQIAHQALVRVDPFEATFRFDRQFFVPSREMVILVVFRQLDFGIERLGARLT